MLAAAVGEVDTVRKLLHMKASVDTQSKVRITLLLIVACMFGCVNVTASHRVPALAV